MIPIPTESIHGAEAEFHIVPARGWVVALDGGGGSGDVREEAVAAWSIRTVRHHGVLRTDIAACVLSGGRLHVVETNSTFLGLYPAEGFPGHENGVQAAVEALDRRHLFDDPPAPAGQEE